MISSPLRRVDEHGGSGLSTTTVSFHRGNNWQEEELTEIFRDSDQLEHLDISDWQLSDRAWPNMVASNHFYCVWKHLSDHLCYFEQRARSLLPQFVD